MKSKPPYLAIAETLREKILSGSYAMGKIPSERALIRQHGVSRATATKALGALEAEGLIVRRRGSGAFIKPTDEASGATYVSTLIADMDVREFFSAICSAIAERARPSNLNLIWGAQQEFSELARDDSLDEYIARCRRANIRGVFFVPQDATGEEGVERRNREIAETLRANGITVVLIDRDVVPFPRRSDFDLVGIDNVQAGYAQAKHLIECGCRRLAYVSHEKLVWTVDARFSGFRNALEECGLRTGEMHKGDPSDPAFARKVERERPDGIAFVHDDMAIAFMATRSRLYKRKVRYIGLDDIDVSRHLGLTSLRQPARFIGEEATRLMALRLGHDTIPPRQVLFSAALTPRASTLAP
ncbi:MAG: GntR family transcriptional regulator [Kiritimatiellae bacterium]|nr:GntR family transcriptional regulator [Kiritimatiellia bacterium]